MRYYREEKSNTRTGTDITLSLLLVAFVVLKLCGVIDWSWWWVLSPLWIPLGILVLILAVIGVMKLVAMIARKMKKRGNYNENHDA